MLTAMILAAGRGERLRPITRYLPKALCEVGGVPLIEYHVNTLAKAGFKRIVINHAYLGGMIKHHLGDGKRWKIQIIYSPEPPGGLETGAGIVQALPLLGDDPFLVINADIFTDYQPIAPSLATKELAHLILVPKQAHHAHGDFGLSSTNHLMNNPKDFIFSGIAYYQPQLFSSCKPGRYSVTPLIRALADNQKATAELFTGSWVDIGSPERLKTANERMFLV